MKAAISVLVVDDHAMVRQMLMNRLDREPDITVVAGVSNADDAVTEAIRLKPDIVMMDIDMPGMVCFDAAKTIRTQCPTARIVFLSAFFHDRYIEQAMGVQAWGYITKSEPEEAVVKAVHNVSAGVAYFSPEVQGRIVVDAQGARLARKKQSRASTLSERELEVLRYLARGMAKKDIARTMYLSVNTVNRHTANIMTKLDMHDRVELARFAIREGLAEA